MAVPASETFSRERILALHRWNDKLISFRLSRPANFSFTPGQFARLGLEQGSGYLWRAYSMVSAPWDETLEFFSIVVPQGQFSARLAAMQVGDEILLDARANGFFTADRLGGGRDLWLLATGTGLAPYLSILQQSELWQRFDAIRLVHGVSYAADLVYQQEIAALIQHPQRAEHSAKFGYLPIVTRATPPGMLGERLPALIASGALETAANLMFSPAHSRVMICGNPKMVAETFRALVGRGLALSRLQQPGQIVLENGW